MTRSIWFAAGAGAGVYVMVRARRLAEAVTIDGLRDRASGALVGLRAFREEVAVGQAEKETELRERLGLVPNEREPTGSEGFTIVGPRPSPPTTELAGRGDDQESSS